MSTAVVGDWLRLPVVQHYAAAFRKATGVTLRVVPPDGPGFQGRPELVENEFCSLVTRTPSTCAACLDTEERMLRKASRNVASQQIHCYAGLTVVAVPVMAGGKHVATLLAGQVFRREPTERDFALVMRMLGPGLDEEWVKQARRAYFETPVVTADRFQGILDLLNVFAEYLADIANRFALSSSEAEPKAVAGAKQFIQSHVEEPITLSQVVNHVHVSRFYFCKLFKKVTGMTLTEYVTRVRVEKAKNLLGDPSLRISEVVFAAGFGSIPRFNSVFKRHVGMPPTEYRASLRSQAPAKAPSPFAA